MDNLTNNVENELAGMFDDLDLNKVNKMIKKVEFATTRKDLDGLIRDFGNTHIRVKKLKQSKRKAQNEVEDLISSLNTLKVIPSAKQRRSALLKALRQKKMKLFNKFVSKPSRQPTYSKEDLFGQMESAKDDELDDLMESELGIGQYDDFGMGDLRLGGKKRKRKRRTVAKKSIKKKKRSIKKGGGKKKKSMKKYKKRKSIKKSMKKVGGKKRVRKTKK
jgi:hypothetical protein